MHTILALFAIVVVPILFFMLTWVIVTALRIIFPEKPVTLEQDRAVVRRRATEEGASVPVGVREIREDQRYFMRQSNSSGYYYAHGDSEGLPMRWMDELHNRRN